MTKYQYQIKKVIFIAFFMGFMFYLCLDYNLKTRLMRFRDSFDSVALVDDEYTITQAYFVDTPGCRMPYFNVTDDTIKPYIFKPLNYSCQKPLTRTSNVGSWLWLNMNDKELLKRYNVSDLRQMKCYYNEFRRQTDEENQHMKQFEFRFQAKKPIKFKAGTEFIRVQCGNMEDMFYEDYHFFVVEKAKMKSTLSVLKENLTGKVPDASMQRFSTFDSVSFSKTLNKLKTKKPTMKVIKPPKEKVSVMILGIDAVSHLNFLRQLKQTYAFVKKHLSHVEFWGYNKVGDNTYPNLIPALTGLDVTELNISCLSTHRNYNYDKCAFIWKKYKKAGYKTVFAEDVAELGLFNYFRPGFRQQPTDYYTRPIVMEMEDNISYKKRGNVKLCKGGRRSIDVILELIRKLLPLLKRQLFFSFIWLATVSHDFLNMSMLLDSDIANIFRVFAEEGIFNNTVVFLMSDHGLRWGLFRETYQGMMEDRQPLLIALYPTWFRQKYPIAIANMEKNSKRLTTHYDLHATMLDLIDLRNLETAQLQKRATKLQETDTIPRSISLFLPIPESRSCELAGISSHWCTCHQKQELPTNDTRVQHAARFIVKQINDKLKPYSQCRILHLSSISEANIAATHRKILEEVTTDYNVDITVSLQTKPGLGEFESTVRVSNSSSIALTGTISRINLYGSQSYCIDDYVLKMFCYCL